MTPEEACHISKAFIRAGDSILGLQSMGIPCGWFYDYSSHIIRVKKDSETHSLQIIDALLTMLMLTILLVENILVSDMMNASTN